MGRGAPAILAVLEHDLAPLVTGEDPRRIERIWERMLWGMHYVGRSGSGGEGGGRYSNSCSAAITATAAVSMAP